MSSKLMILDVVGTNSTPILKRVIATQKLKVFAMPVDPLSVITQSALKTQFPMSSVPKIPQDQPHLSPPQQPPIPRSILQLIIITVPPRIIALLLIPTYTTALLHILTMPTVMAVPTHVKQSVSVRGAK